MLNETNETHQMMAIGRETTSLGNTASTGALRWKALDLSNFEYRGIAAAPSTPDSQFEMYFAKDINLEDYDDDEDAVWNPDELSMEVFDDFISTPKDSSQTSLTAASNKISDERDLTCDYLLKQGSTSFKGFAKEIAPTETILSNTRGVLPDPTPVAPLEMRIVEEIKLGSLWNHDDESTQLLTLLLMPNRDKGRSRKVNSKNAARNAMAKPDSWDERMEELIKYRKQFGNCLVPHNWKGNRVLAQWVKRQRHQAKLKREGRHTALTDERVQALEDIGFVWSSQEAGWDEKFQALRVFAKQHGHCNVPSRYPCDRKLAVWVRCQRRCFKLKHENHQELDPLAQKRFLKLQLIGFDFKPRL